MEHRLSSPPHATIWLCVCSNAHVMTHELRSGIDCTLCVVYLRKKGGTRGGGLRFIRDARRRARAVCLARGSA